MMHGSSDGSTGSDGLSSGDEWQVNHAATKCNSPVVSGRLWGYMYKGVRVGEASHPGPQQGAWEMHQGQWWQWYEGQWWLWDEYNSESEQLQS